MKTSSSVSRVLATATLAAALALPAGLSMAAAAKGSYAGKTKAEITKTLEQQGYKVRKVETEDGELEAYALLDGARYEIYVDPESGKIVKIKQDD